MENAAAAGAQIDEPEPMVTWEEIEVESFNTTNSSAAFDVAASSFPISVSALFVPQLNAFDVAFFEVTDNYVERAIDDGRSEMAALAWEVHDEGDKSSNAASSSFSGVDKLDWVSVEDFAVLIGRDVATITPENFANTYNETWTQIFEAETTQDNIDPVYDDFVLEEIEVGDESGVGGDATTIDESTAGSSSVENGDSSPGSRRKLAFSPQLGHLLGALHLFGF